MVQKSTPYLNKTGYSMFWNSMWDSKNDYSKNLQKDHFIKSFLNYFFSDYIFNKFFYKYKFNGKNLNTHNITNKYTFNILGKNIKYVNQYINNFYNTDFVLSKIWFFKYQNWLIVYFFLYSQTNMYFKKSNQFYFNSEYKNNFYNYLNNYYFNKFNKNKQENHFYNSSFKKYNF